MKTLEEVVEGLRDQMGLGDPVLADALFYLKEYQEKRDEICEIAKIMADSWELHKQTMAFEDRNDPISWDELRQMEGKPVWVEYNLHLSDKDARSRSRMWIIVQDILSWQKDEELIYYSGFVFGKKEIGKTWRAYRKERS